MAAVPPQEVSDFSTGIPIPWNSSALDAQRQRNVQTLDAFQQAQLVDLSSRQKTRLKVAIYVGILLFLQNIAVFGLVIFAFANKMLPNLQWFFGALMAGTLAETYKLVELVMKWLFTDKPYKPDHDG